jgi:hypothetical protein
MFWKASLALSRYSKNLAGISKSTSPEHKFFGGALSQE